MPSPIQLSLQELPTNEALDQARDQIQGRLAETGSRLAHLNWGIMRNAAGGALQKALGKLDLLDYVADAWCTATELQEIAERSLKAPGTEGTLAIAEHSPSILLHPTVKIKCGPVEFPALTFELNLGVAVESAVLIVSDGKLTAIEAGSFTPYARLSYDGQALKELNGDEVTIVTRFCLPGGGIAIRCSPGGGGDWTAL